MNDSERQTERVIAQLARIADALTAGILVNQVAGRAPLFDKLETADAPHRTGRHNSGSVEWDSLRRPTIVCICGSMRFEDDMQEAAREESVAGRIVVGPSCNMKVPHRLWSSTRDADRVKGELDVLHRRKIDLADEVLVVTRNGYIGGSTAAEIDYALATKKPVRYWQPTP